MSVNQSSHDGLPDVSSGHDVGGHGGRLRVLVWHLHGSWMTSFVQGGHQYLIPAGGSADSQFARGRAGRNWPPNAVEVRPESLTGDDIDVVVLQRPDEIDLTEEWFGARPGRDIPAVYVEHNTPRHHAATSRHPMTDEGIPIVHVTDFNNLMWDCGNIPTTVIRHGIVDPGYLYTGTENRAAAMINEPERRWRITGTDVLGSLSRWSDIDLFGIGTVGIESRNPLLRKVCGRGDLSQPQLHAEVARRRVYVHTSRWTSLGLSLIEAMHLGMPVVALGTTDVPISVPTDAGVVATNIDELGIALAEFVNEPAAARLAGKRGREWATEQFGLHRFLAEWDHVLYRTCDRTDTSRKEYSTP